MIEATTSFKNWIQDQTRSGDHGDFALSPELRSSSLSVLNAGIFPTRKDEEWRYTPLKDIIDRNLGPVAVSKFDAALVEVHKKAIPDALHIVFINGEYSIEFSDDLALLADAGLTIQHMTDLDTSARQKAEGIVRSAKLSDDNIFQHITLALSRSGLFIRVHDNVEIERPLHLLFLSSTASTTSFSNPINIIHVGRNSRLKIVEQFASTEDAQAVTTPADYIHLDKGSSLDLYKLGVESEGTDHISNVAVAVNEAAEINLHQYLIGSRLTRSNSEIYFSQPGANANLRGLFLGDKSQHLDIRTYMDHAQPHCSSDQNFRGIMNDRSRGVFNGMVLVREHAQHTDAQQSNKNLLLSRDARVDTKPQLEIFADDVKCTHGATIGELDEDALFYLQSRGISKADATLMLTRAFAAEITQEIQIDSLREYILEAIANKLTNIPDTHA